MGNILFREHLKRKCFLCSSFIPETSFSKIKVCFHALFTIRVEKFLKVWASFVCLNGSALWYPKCKLIFAYNSFDLCFLKSLIFQLWMWNKSTTYHLSCETAYILIFQCPQSQIDHWVSENNLTFVQMIIISEICVGVSWRQSNANYFGISLTEEQENVYYH